MVQTFPNEVGSIDMVVRKTQQNFKTKIGKEYSTKDVIKTWDCISKWIENNLNQDKGILLKGIGYFSIVNWDKNMRKPIFVIDEKLAKDYNLQRRRDYNSGNIQERYLNLISVAHEYQLNINMATHCFNEVVSAFRKLLFEEKDCELPFPKIGKLQVKNKTVKMKFYQEFLERQNQYLKQRTEEEKRKLQSESYNPDWNADQFKNQQRPCSAMSVITRPASSLSQYRPGAGYESVLPCDEANMDRPQSSLSIISQNKPTSRPGSRTSVHSYEHTRPASRTSIQSYKSNRPGSRTSIKSNEQMRPISRTSITSRPSSSLSQCRTGSGYKSVFPNDEDNTDRPQSSLSNRSQNKPNSKMSVRPGSRTSVNSYKQSRPASRTSIQSYESNRPESRTSTKSNDNTRPISITSITSRPSSSLSECRTGSGYKSVLPKAEDNTDRPQSSLSNRSQNKPNSKMSVRPGSRTSIQSYEQTRSTSKTSVQSCEQIKPMSKKSKNRPNSKQSKLKFGACENIDETLCCSCNIRKNRLDQINLLKPDLSSLEKKDNFMKGDNPIDRLLTIENESKRNSLQKEIAKYNYITAQELENKINNEKTKIRSEINNERCILNNRPPSNRSAKLMDLKHSLLDQINHNNAKKEEDKITSLKNENLLRQELLKSLHDERIKNIEAKIRSKKNLCIILDEHLKKKSKTEKEAEMKSNITPTFNTMIGTDEHQRQSNAKLNKHKLAEYHLKQKSALNLVNKKQKEGNIDFERNLLNKLKEEDEEIRKNVMQKKLCRKKLLAEDLNKLLIMEENERRKNEIPGAYPMKFPLNKIGERCRLCKKNRPGYLGEKISDLPC